MKKELYLATVNLPICIDSKLHPDAVINHCMYCMQGKEILLQKINDPIYDFIDDNLYILNKNIWEVKKRNKRILTSKRRMFVDTCFWCTEWLDNVRRFN